MKCPLSHALLAALWLCLFTSSVPAITYEEWSVTKFGAGADPLIAGAECDPDFDGRTNLLEYALGSDRSPPRH
jgi:hypothetical protein